MNPQPALHLFFNCLAASSGSGPTYVRNVVPHLAACPELRATVATHESLREEAGNPPNVSFLEINAPANAALRFLWEQTHLSRLIRANGANVLISTGNFALRRSPVPQILLAGNALYLSPDFERDLRSRGAYAMWLDTRLRAALARRSIHWAERTIAPSQTFAEQLRAWTGRDIHSVYHGFDREVFFAHHTAPPVELQRQLEIPQDTLRLLFVSHYNYYRNFETLLRALPLIKARLDGKAVKLFLTCKLRSEDTPGSYRAERAAALVRELGISDNVVELGAIPYRLLQHVYRACDIYVTPAYAETFAHPLVEAMACGLPIVASHLPVHAEVCRDAALYFPRFSASELAAAVTRVGQSRELREHLGNAGLRRSQHFSWRNHVQQIVTVARRLSNATQALTDNLLSEQPCENCQTVGRNIFAG